MLLALLCAQTPFTLPPVPLTHASALDDIRAFDADGDGDTDVVATFGPHALVLVRQGPAGFLAPETILESPSVLSYDIGDLDADGDVDVVARTSDQALTIARNDGTGAFTLTTTPTHGAIFARPCVADLDGDGDQDVFYDSTYETAAWHENLGGVLASGRLLDLGVSVGAVAAADFDMDGFDDVLVESSLGVRILRNLGGLQFGPPSPYVSSGSYFLKRARAVDLDGVAPLDLLLTLPNGQTHAVLDPFGTATLAFTNASDLAPYDVDLDGDLDLVLGGGQSGGQYAESLGAGVFGALQDLPVTGPIFGRSLEVVDVDGDGVLDIASPERWLRGLPALSAGVALDPSPRTILQRAGRSPEPVALDLEGDGDVDLVAVALSGASVVLECTGPSRYALARRIDLELVDRPIAHDVDGDGLADLIGLRTPAELGWQRNLGGTFAPVVPVDTLPTIELHSFAIADLDADGLDELVFAAEEGPGTPHRIGAVEWTGTAWGSPTTLATFGRKPVELDLADVNGDAIIDAVVRVKRDFPNEPARIVFFPGVAGGAFGPRQLVWEEEDNAILSESVASIGASATPSLYVATTAELLRFAWTGTGFGGPTLYSVLDVAGADVRLTGVALGTLFQGPFSSGGAVFSTPIGTYVRQLGNAQESFIGGGELEPQFLTDVDGDGDLDLFLLEDGRRLVLHPNGTYDVHGVVYCGSGSPNSTGAPGRLLARGNPTAGDDALELVAYDLPAAVTALFLASENGGLVPNVGGSAGTLCLGGQIGRFTAPGQVVTTNTDGSAYLDLDLDALPQPMGTVSALAGDLWRFQCWYRDGAGSNLTEAVAVSIL